MELFLDQRLRWPKLAIALRLGLRKLGFRALMDEISLDENLVRGSHGRPPDDPARGPLLISSEPDLLPKDMIIPATSVKAFMLAHVFGTR